MPEAKYRFYFKQYTFGLADEEVARLWVNNLEYEGPAHLWYENLASTAAGKTAVEKWTTLEPEIEKRWPTPQRDVEAQRISMRRAWEKHGFKIEPMLEKLADETCAVKPHQMWAEDHKALGRNVNSTDEDRVAKTLKFDLPVWLVNLLPKGERYGDHFDELIKDIGAMSSRALLDAYQKELVYAAILTPARTLTLSSELLAPAGQHQTPSSRHKSPAHPLPPQPQTLQPPASPFANPLTPRRSASHVRFSPGVQQSIIPLNDTRPRAEPRSLPQTPATARDPPPHISAPPPTPATPVTSVAARIAAAAQPRSAPPASPKLDDSQRAQDEWRSQVDHWHTQYPNSWPSLRRPYPLSPGTFEQTADLCPKCGKGDHTMLRCMAAAGELLSEHERRFREQLLRSMRDSTRRAGTQLGTPTPSQRFRDSFQVEFSSGESDPDSDRYVSGNE